MSEKSYTSWYFLFSVVIIYIITGVLAPSVVIPSLSFSLNIIINIIPVFALVFAVMALFNYFVSPKAISKYIGRSSGVKRWLIAIAGGIASTGPIYMWYPLLKDLKTKGVSYGFIAAFLYNRAIKIPLIPILVFYFGLKYVIILTIVMIVVSIFQGFLFERIEKVGFV